MNAEELKVLANGDIVLNKSYGTTLIGNSSKVSTWVQVFEGYNRYSDVPLSSIIEKVWNKIPTPSKFGATFNKNHKGELSLYSLCEPFESVDVLITSDRVRTDVSNPFVLSDLDKERIQEAIEAHEMRTKEEYAQKSSKRAISFQEIIFKAQEYISTNPGLELEGEGNHIIKYKIVLVVNGVQAYKIPLYDFTRKAWPELWEEMG
jgi:hypothetical protein